MYVDYSGWNERQGPFACSVFVDEKKTDYSVVYGDGTVSRQMTPFEHVTADWNNDGERYTLFGAWFDSAVGGNTFLTPEELVRAAVDSKSKDHFYGNEIKKVNGISFPFLDRRPTLDEQIIRSEQRALNQDAERNRKMDALGIRPSGEPWER